MSCHTHKMAIVSWPFHAILTHVCLKPPLGSSSSSDDDLVAWPAAHEHIQQQEGRRGHTASLLDIDRYWEMSTETGLRGDRLWYGMVW